MDKWHVYLYGIMWDADPTEELPENLRCTVDADDHRQAVLRALEVASEEFETGIEGTEQIETIVAS